MVAHKFALKKLENFKNLLKFKFIFCCPLIAKHCLVCCLTVPHTEESSLNIHHRFFKPFIFIEFPFHSNFQFHMLKLFIINIFGNKIRFIDIESAHKIRPGDGHEGRFNFSIIKYFFLMYSIIDDVRDFLYCCCSKKTFHALP